MPRLSHILLAKAAIAGLLPIVAWAAMHQMPAEDALAKVSAVMWLWVVVFSASGWAIADLDKIAELWNPALGSAYERIKATLTLWKGVIASVGAGVGTFFLAELAPGPVMAALGIKMADGAPPNLPDMIELLLVAGAGYMGTRWWSRIETKIPGG